MKKFIIGGIIIAAIGVMILVNVLKGNSDGTNGGTSSLTRGRTVAVEAETIGRDTITSSILISGSVEEVNKKEITSSTPIKVAKVMVAKGDVVKIGDQLFTADLESLTKELEQLNINFEIQTLTKEKLIALSGNADNTSLELALKLSQLGVDSAERFYETQLANLEKNQSLFDGGLISATEYESLQSSVTEAESQLASAKVSYQRSQADLSSVRKQSASSERSTEIDLEIQQKNLDGLAMNIQSLEEQIAEIEALTYASMAGVVTELNVHEEEFTSTMLPLVVIRDIDTLQIVANIREYDIGDVALGQEVLISGDAIAKNELVFGTVSYIAPIAEETVVNNRQVTAIEVEIAVTEGSEYIKPGYTTDCEIVTSKLEDVVIVAYNMLSKDEEGNDIVFVVDDNFIAKERQVELGATSDFDAEVISGVEDGDLIVVNPSLSLFDGTKVELIEEEEGK